MESGLLCDFFGNFSRRDERYYFHMEGDTQDGHGMRPAMQGGNGGAD